MGFSLCCCCRKSKIYELDAFTLAYHDVIRLDISVKYTVLVEVINGLYNLCCDDVFLLDGGVVLMVFKVIL